MKSRRLSGTPPNCRGFTLLELLVVIVISGVLLGGLLVPLSTRIQMQSVHEEERNLVEVRDTLIGFAQSQGRLPCPDTNGDGAEDPCTGNSVAELPYATLGLDPVDNWGRRYRYGVSGAMTVQALTGVPAPNAGLDLTDNGALRVRERLNDKSVRNIATTAAAVVVSLGRNGFGGTNSDGNTLRAPPAPAADEPENLNGDTTFITRTRTDEVTPCSDVAGTAPMCEFDDLVIHIPTPLLFGRMVQAGQLP